MRATRKISQLPLVRGVQELKNMENDDFQKSKFKEDGMEYQDFLKIKNSRSGYIHVKKLSDNPGYLNNNEGREGFTPLFSEGFSCHIFLDDLYEDYYYTSTIESIDWHNNTFTTKNSEYSFVFKEMSPEDYDKTIL
jgi:hypothetical protein